MLLAALSHAHPAAPSRREALLAGPRLIEIGAAAQRGYTAIDFAGGARSPVGGDGRWSRAFARRDDRAAVVAQARAPADVDRWTR